jgi:hypothetical protein
MIEELKGLASYRLPLVIGDSPSNKKLAQNTIMNHKCYYISLWQQNWNHCVTK